MRLRVGGISALVIGILLAAHPASGQVGINPPPPPPSEYAPEFRRFGVYDYVGTAALAGAFYVVEFTQENAQSPTWKNPILFDRATRDWLVADSRHEREVAVTWANWLWYASVAYPVFDEAITPAIRTGRAEVSWNMTMMSFQAFALTSLVIRIPHKWLGRTRPDSIGCETDPDYSNHCGKQNLYASFPGGHVSVSMTGAGLSCAHHVHGKLYGSPVADGLACGAALAAATAVGWLRIRSDSHWASDQLAGAGIGLFSGYVVPTLLYYHPFWRAPRPEPAASAAPARIVALPWIDQQTFGAAVLIVD